MRSGGPFGHQLLQLPHGGAGLHIEDLGGQDRRDTWWPESDELGCRHRMFGRAESMNHPEPFPVTRRNEIPVAGVTWRKGQSKVTGKVPGQMMQILGCDPTLWSFVSDASCSKG